MHMRLACCLLLITTSMLGAATVAIPPGKLPVKVKVGFYLLNLNGVDEKQETFEADTYMFFEWKDERLQHAGKVPLLFVEEAAKDKLEEIWSPQIEFVNTSKPEITNENLAIMPDGTVILTIGLTSTFRTDLDLRRFPLDRQRLRVAVSSFTYEDTDVVFVADNKMLGFEPESTYEGLRVTGVTAETTAKGTVSWSGSYSIFNVFIDVDRNTGFYLWTVFGPVVLIFLISCTVYLVPAAEFSNRISICLTALLACIATQFALSFSLPQISYMTLIDRLFISTYGFVALNVLIISAEMFLEKRNAWLRKCVNRTFGFLVPVAYLASVGAALFL